MKSGGLSLQFDTENGQLTSSFGAGVHSGFDNIDHAINTPWHLALEYFSRSDDIITKFRNVVATANLADTHVLPAKNRHSQPQHDDHFHWIATAGYYLT